MPLLRHMFSSPSGTGATNGDTRSFCGCVDIGSMVEGVLSGRGTKGETMVILRIHVIIMRSCLLSEDVGGRLKGPETRTDCWWRG